MQTPNPHYSRRGNTASVNRNLLAKRRSSRIALKTPIGLSGEDALKCAFTTTASATNLNQHGATIQSTRALNIGTTVLVRNKRGAQIPARVVAQVKGVEGLRCYGIEFLEHDNNAQNFWGIYFPAT